MELTENVAFDLAPTSQATPQARVEADPEKWEFDVTLYLWFASVDGVASAGPLGFPINTSFRDLVSEMNIGGMLAFGGKKGQWGFKLDGIYTDMGGSSPGVTGTVDTDIKALIAEIDVTFSPLGAPGLDFLAGARILDIEQQIRLSAGPSSSGSETLVDPVIGAQGVWDLGTDWKFLLRGDVGGFGVSSEMTYQILTSFRWQFAESWGLDFGYRLMGYDIKTSDVNLDAQFHGLIVGVDFVF